MRDFFHARTFPSLHPRRTMQTDCMTAMTPRRQSPCRTEASCNTVDQDRSEIGKLVQQMANMLQAAFALWIGHPPRQIASTVKTPACNGRRTSPRVSVRKSFADRRLMAQISTDTGDPMRKLRAGGIAIMAVAVG